MAVDSNFNSLLQNLKLDEPWLPSKPWESISSESGISRDQKLNSFQRSFYDPSTISVNLRIGFFALQEANLVRLAINALQGVEASLYAIEKLSESFCTDPADRTCHRIPSLWYRSSSTNALGKVLKSIGRSGFVAFLIRKFVDYFRCQTLSVGGTNKEESGRKQGDVEFEGSRSEKPCSLVNQAFAVALEKVLEGFICGLDTLNASVQLRRSSKSADTYGHISSGVGCLTSVVLSEVTFMEVYLHTKDLRTQVEAMGNICMFKNVALAFSTLSLEDLTTEATMGFSNFPKGADLLSYLYYQLRDADPAHQALFKFLFIRSCEPYYGFIKSWIYEARINDPYKEFIVEYVDISPPYSHGGAGFFDAVWLSSIRVREGVSVPCFLENFCLPLIRAGQQLQVLIKLLQLCNCVSTGGITYEDILPCWSGSSSFCWSTMSPLTFNKTEIEEMALMRKNMYRLMREKLHILLARLDRRYQPMTSNVIPFGIEPAVGGGNRDTVNIPISCSMDRGWIIRTAGKGDLDSEAGSHESDTSGAVDDISYQVDPFESSSECSSWSSSGELNETEGPFESLGSSNNTELRYISASEHFKNLLHGQMLPNPSQHQMPSAHHKDTLAKISDEEKELSYISEYCVSENTKLARFSETVFGDYQSVNCWPLGGLLKNPFCDGLVPKGESQSHVTGSSLEVLGRIEEVFMNKVSYFAELFASGESSPQQARGNIQLENGTQASSTSYFLPLSKLNYNCNIFNINPMLTKNCWCDMMDKLGGDHKQSFVSYFDFSSVEDPRMVYREMSIPTPGHGYQSKLQFFLDHSVSSAKGDSNCFGEQNQGKTVVPVDQINSYSVTLPGNRQEETASTNSSGGAEWESSLSYLGKRFKHSIEGRKKSLGSIFNIPLDFIIDKCMLQEILIHSLCTDSSLGIVDRRVIFLNCNRYEYISDFSIMLLEEGFDLQGHLLALRRYYFMEFADWADLFIMSLWHHKWSVAEASQRISEIQGFLDLAVQRSSCEADPYKERLYLYKKGHVVVPLSTPGTGVHAFDFIALGYRVDWPVNIVLTPSALKTYSDIFSFLIQVKLAVFSLTDVWSSMKDLVHLISQSHHCQLDKQEKTIFNILMKMRAEGQNCIVFTLFSVVKCYISAVVIRHQLNHFVSTLQQYVQSQLSDVSWCRFLHSLKHQVKDMFDLESVHMAYLTDSLHICFLSDQTRPVAGIIESILQCALDFRSCFTGVVWEVGFDCRDSSRVLGGLNISQVLAIKAVFVKNLKELYLCYLKSPKHGEFSLSRFWGYLNYNDYYSSIIGSGLVHYAL
ncbi:hypothetical protein IFM89_006761 [Coptis chinensis]|uniref:Gamma-tubulin complex component n=1 Tax=Coptis chinensis TaxID=261450 RepID=A0A835IAL9_9MAGN|nr:hypothetical protein IFM89_006761 [Coptis chinensis]